MSGLRGLYPGVGTAETLAEYPSRLAPVSYYADQQSCEPVPPYLSCVTSGGTRGTTLVGALRVITGMTLAKGQFPHRRILSSTIDEMDAYLCSLRRS